MNIYILPVQLKEISQPAERSNFSYSNSYSTQMPALNNKHTQKKEEIFLS